MKAINIITAGLIAGTTLYRVDGIEYAPQGDRGTSSRTVTVTYREPSRTEAAPTLFGDLTDSDLRCMNYGGLQAVHLFNGGTARKNTVQVVVIEPRRTHIGTATGPDWILDPVLVQPQRPHERFKWFDPRRVLLKWVALWTTDIQAQPVVLVQHEF